MTLSYVGPKTARQIAKRVTHDLGLLDALCEHDVYAILRDDTCAWWVTQAERVHGLRTSRNIVKRVRERVGEVRA